MKDKYCSGLVINNWTIIKFFRYMRGHNHWLCRCKCGNEVVINQSTFSTKTKSCIRCMGNNNRIHGKCGTKTYNAWSAMLDRCRNKNNEYYTYYGGRGITVCERWYEFKNFLEDMGEAPKGLSLDRINNDDNYYKENCRWATNKEQMRNTSLNRYYNYSGISKSISEWAEIYNIDTKNLWNRLVRMKWPFEKAISTPIKKYNIRRNI